MPKPGLDSIQVNNLALQHLLTLAGRGFPTREGRDCSMLQIQKS